MQHAPLFLLIIYIALINIYAVFITIYDKGIAVKNGNLARQRKRVPEKMLLAIAAMGGSVAMLVTMYKIRHKTQHRKFMWGIPAIILAQILLIVLLIVIF